LFFELETVTWLGDRFFLQASDIDSMKLWIIWNSSYSSMHIADLKRKSINRFFTGNNISIPF